MFKRNISKKPTKQKKGQSTVEYVILVAAVLTVLLIFLKPNGIFHQAVNGSLSDGTETMENMTGRLQGSHQ